MAMKKPYIICHMMMSIDGRIDCAMTEQIHGANEYYSLLKELNVPTTLSGRVTGRLLQKMRIRRLRHCDRYKREAAVRHTV